MLHNFLLQTPDKDIGIEKIKQAIPSECFNKDPFLGIHFISFDFMCWATTVSLYYSIENKTLLIKMLYWLSSGFFMWCQFMNGHDCGHGSFSDSPILNSIMGHVSHTPLMVPFATWAESHRRHHMGHNHFVKDYSHPFVDGPDDKHYFKIVELTGTYSLFGWFFYMIGLPDGGHWIPIGGRLWNNDYNIYTHIHCIFSSTLVFGWLYFILSICNFNFYTFMEWYGMSWLVFSWWITTVTYLQHHDNTPEDTVVYGDKSWTFMKGALQTVDRSYGVVIDKLTHNITNGHLVHHIFFRQIPHYHLEKATRHLYKFLDENGIEYKYRYTPYFFIDIFNYTMNHMSEVKYIY